MYSQGLNNALQEMGRKDHENFNAYLTAGNKVFTRISQIIEANSRYSIARKKVAGSIGKKTALGLEFEPDFDVVLFVNDVRRGLKPVVEDFFEILKTHVPRSCEEWTSFSGLKKTTHSVGFTVETRVQLPTGAKIVQIEYDLLPAYNFCSYGYDANRQAQLAMEKVKENPRDWYEYSSSMCEKLVQYVEGQPDWIRYVIRLAKLWDKELKNKTEREGGRSYFSGRSSMIELVAMDACKGLYGGGMGNILQAFKAFLCKMQRLDSVNVNHQSNAYYNYPYGVNPHQKPLIWDCVNYYNNYASNIDDHMRNVYSRRATETLNTLEQAERSYNNWTDI